MARVRARLPGQTLVCAWCSREFAIAARGRIPKWCSQSCRQRAWEQRRAAQSGLPAVEVVQQVVEVERIVSRKVVERVEVAAPLGRRDWPAVLAELVDQLERGRVYDRDLVDLATALRGVLKALERRPAYQRLMRRPTRLWR